MKTIRYLLGVGLLLVLLVVSSAQPTPPPVPGTVPSAEQWPAEVAATVGELLKTKAEAMAKNGDATIPDFCKTRSCSTKSWLRWSLKHPGMGNAGYGLPVQESNRHRHLPCWIVGLVRDVIPQGSERPCRADVAPKLIRHAMEKQSDERQAES